jgi:superfamily II DNA/RNA helicase
MFTEKLDIPLLESLEENGLTESTGLQHICIPKIKSGRDLICIADDETGKSTTIVIGVLQKLKASLDDNPRAIVVVADTDRANVLKAEFERLGSYTDLRVFTACEDQRIDNQKDQIYMGSDVVIGTPKRLNQLYSVYALNLTMTKIFAIDDAEEVIKSVNYPQFDRLSESMPRAQKLIFASHVTDWIDRFANEFMNVQEIIEIGEDDEDDSTETV